MFTSCGGDAATTRVAQQTTAPAGTTTPAATSAPTQTTATTPPTENCGEPAIEIDLGSPISLEIVGVDQPPRERLYFCVQVPDGVASLTFELTEATADLNLYVGYPDLETLQEGGVAFWFSRERGTVDKMVIAGPGIADFMNPGPYYIEVSGQDFGESSPFTLNARAT